MDTTVRVNIAVISIHIAVFSRLDKYSEVKFGHEILIKANAWDTSLREKLSEYCS